MKQWLTGAIVLALFSCTNHNKIPSGVIPPDKMKEVFLDMLQADRYASSFLSRNKDSLQLKQETFTLYREVFDIHRITEKEFKKSYLFYMGRPDLSIALFDSVSALGERRRNEYYEERMRNDSIKASRARDSVDVKNLPEQLEDSIAAVKDSFAIKKDSLLRQAFRKRRADSTLKKLSGKQADTLGARSRNEIKP